MKKYFSVLFIAMGMLLAVPAQAQLIKFGVKGGVNLSKPKFQSSNMNGKSYTGFFFGPTAEVKIPFLGFGVDGALLYSQCGIDNERGDLDVVKQKEIIVPLNLKYTLGSSLAGIFFFAGPQFGFNLDKNGNDNKHSYSFSTANVSMNVGLGFKLVKHLQISGNYNIPFNNTANYTDETAQGQERWCKNKSWQFSAAWFF